MAGLAPDFATSEFNADHVSRDTKRGLLLGSLAGAATGIFLLSAMDLPAGVGHLWNLLSSGLLAEFGSELTHAVLLALRGMVFGLLAGAPSALPFIIAMSLSEKRHPILQILWIWGLAGALFAIPPAIWLMAEMAKFDIDGGGRWHWEYLYFNMACGFIGGIAAWRGYYRPVRSDP